MGQLFKDQIVPSICGTLHTCFLPPPLLVHAEFLLNVPGCSYFIKGRQGGRFCIFHMWAQILSGRGESVGPDVVVATALKREKLVGEQGKCREKDQSFQLRLPL